MRKVLITGGNKGIGLEVTKLFLTRGDYIYCVAREFKDFLLEHKNINKIIFDLTEVSHIPQLISKIGHLDILINNAGFMNAYPYNSYPEKAKKDIIAVNLDSPLELIKQTVPSMSKNKWGRIVNLASLAGVTGHPDIWYGITKAGLINATISLSHLLKNTGITINAIAPGPVNTQMIKTITGERKEMLRNNLLVTGSYMDPIYIANTIFWLTTDEAQGINGECIELNPAITWK